MSASTYINIEITYQSHKDKFYIDYIYNNNRYDTAIFYDRYAAQIYLCEMLGMTYDDANALIDDVINNS